ncbi:hypothetical protein ACP4OV_006201 [Aristida adscensionis]
MGAESPTRTIVFVPFPAQGHVTPMLHLARAIAARGGVAATVAVPDFVHRRIGHQHAAAAAGGVALAPIPSGVPDDGGEEPPPASTPSCTPWSTTCRRTWSACCWRGAWRAPSWMSWRPGPSPWPRGAACRPWLLAGHVRQLPRRGGHPGAYPQGVHLGIRTPLPLSTNGTVNEGQDLNKLHILPSELELSTKDLPWLVGGAASQKSRFAFWLHTVDRAKSLRTILVNSFPGEGAGDSDRYEPPPGLRVLHVGPLLLQCCNNAAASMWRADTTCMDWLDRQSPGSVVYVSFGSWVAPIGPEKIAEFAAGLEAAGRPFLWVLKDHPSWRAGLPGRFAENVAGRGKIVSWAPQEDVLRHEAVGCYVTHCGWNSTLEAVRHRVPMICYPISGDQFIDCAYIVKMWQAVSHCVAPIGVT